MKIFIPLFSLLSLILAEPPVSDGYAAARSNQHDHHHGHHHGSDHHQFHEHRAGVRNTPSQSYLPAARISPDYQAPESLGLSQEYGVPDARSIPSQEYGAPNTRSGSTQHSDTLSLDFSDSYPVARSPSPQYGVPELRSTPYKADGASAQRSFNSAPFPTQKYGIPRGSSSRASQLRSNTISQGYSAPSTKNTDISQSYSAPRNIKTFSAFRSPAQTYGAPRNFPGQTYGAPGSRTLSTSYGAPNARNFGSYSQEGKSVSQSYGLPSNGARVNVDTIEVASARGQSQEYGSSSHSSNLMKTNAVASSYAGARHATHDASGYDTPAAQYGVPQQYSAQENQGYQYARAGLDEQLEEEEASYDFAYKVEDYGSESDFGHQETREDNKVEGSYFVVLPDGTKQTVEYEADEGGFRPRISLERTVVSTRAGYDENAQDLSQGPY